MVALTARSVSRNRRAFSTVIALCILFVVFTCAAMVLFPGGNSKDHAASSYSFSRNYFSDLGRMRLWDGRDNTVCSALFFLSMASAGSGLMVFCLAIPRLFASNRLLWRLSALGSCIGVFSASCFFGVGATPYDANPHHGAFVMNAFRTFPVAAILYAICMFRQPGYPRRYALLFAAFAALLVVYVFLMEAGPKTLEIQVLGQKAIAYASVLSILAQAVGARRLLSAGPPSP